MRSREKPVIPQGNRATRYDKSLKIKGEPVIANDALSQLSYSPNGWRDSKRGGHLQGSVRSI